MSSPTAVVWLTRAYGAALILHGAFVLLVVALAVLSVVQLGAGANAAREGAGLSLLVFFTTFLGAIPSILAVLSWWLCRRNNWTPSTGHMFLTVFAAVVLLVLILMAYMI